MKIVKKLVENELHDKKRKPRLSFFIDKVH